MFDYFIPNQYLPFFLNIFYFFFNNGCKLIYDAFYFDTLIKSYNILFLGNGKIELFIYFLYPNLDNIPGNGF